MATNTVLSRSVAAKVSAALSTAGVPQRDAAKRTGIPTTTLSRRLTGKSPFNVYELALIAELLEVNVSDFFPQDAA